MGLCSQQTSEINCYIYVTFFLNSSFRNNKSINKTGNVHITNVEARSVDLCVCNCKLPACNAHESYCHLWPVRLFSTLPHYLTSGPFIFLHSTEKVFVIPNVSRPRKTWMEGIQAAMTTRNLEPDQWRNREEWRLVSGRRQQLF